MTLTEKVAYIKGLTDGLELDKATKEGKVIAALIDIIDDMALTLTDNCERIDAVDEDLAALEDYVLEDDECPGDCEGCDGCDGYEDEDEDMNEFECPNCHETIFFDDSLFEDEDFELECPACGIKLNGIFEPDDNADSTDE